LSKVSKQQRGKNTFLMYSPDCINVCGSTGGEFEGRCGELKVVKSCSYEGTSCSLVQTVLLFIHSTQTDRHTDRRQYHANSRL